MAPHSFREHTGELKLHLESATLEGLFVEAAIALAEIMGGHRREHDAATSAEGPAAASQVRLRAPDRDALLVDWLNELIYASERNKRIYDQIALQSLSDRSLVAEVRGRATERLRLPVKAATFHGLRIEQGRSGFSADVILDV